MANVGLTITEGVNNGVSPFRDASKRNIGLAGQFNRGGAFKATKITSMEDFNVIFGGQNDAFYGPRIVKSIFDEAGNAPVTLPCQNGGCDRKGCYGYCEFGFGFFGNYGG